MREHDVEPIPGLPEALPPGEMILWQGRPDWRCFAHRAFRAPIILAYFGVLSLWGLVTALGDGAGLVDTVLVMARPLGLAALLLSLIGGFCWLTARTTLHTVTNRRVVMRFGIALPVSMNLPFSKIDAARVHINSDGTGDIALAMTADNHLAYAFLWPHARPWALRHPEPTLRCIPDVARVANILAPALSSYAIAAARQTTPLRVVPTTPSPAPASAVA